MGYICKKGKKNGLAMREPGQEDGSQKLKRSRGGDATVKWKQSCRRSKGLERGDEMNEDQDIKMW